MTSSNGLECEFNNQDEVDFLFSFLDKKKDVLEWGSGLSTLAIGKRCKSLVSIEHDERFFKSTSEIIGVDSFNKHIAVIWNNVSLFHINQNQEPTSKYDDGTYEDFKDYVEFPKTLNKKFDVVFIDGRARVDCARRAVKLLKKNGVIIIHDIFHPDEKYHRKEYDVVTEFLESISGVFAINAFKPKK